MTDWYAPNQQAVGVEPAAGAAPEEQGAPGKLGFDPGAHTVAAVLDYIEAHPDERDAILAAEADGKARVSLVGEDG